ncbi:uncharacterized protein AMSG_00461 [Thecamonas trahens ATCC 50062]|uniref:Uncharacterized protein n=1 Tax=Thecamonas trahens ATCC 50062 TaxID=461836 RepID=A0A0L0D8L2_THETB|nr:hypothetical protein AMSG_00461 [Thecamonas trahens ATCC 50062]KNC48684.1 hypothetical protein AMSG_00461 [Thecamonas trahens ATCC 50062]|eukprot:XP_013762740.1 hypothetical protein AMSG_00461 [Thecamonas trahens ATCC 50062]
MGTQAFPPFEASGMAGDDGPAASMANLLKSALRAYSTAAEGTHGSYAAALATTDSAMWEASSAELPSRVGRQATSSASAAGGRAEAGPDALLSHGSRGGGPTGRAALAKAFAAAAARLVDGLARPERNAVINVVLDALHWDGGHRPRVGLVADLLEALVGQVFLVDDILPSVLYHLRHRAQTAATVEPLACSAVLACVRSHVHEASLATCTTVLDLLLKCLESLLPPPPAALPRQFMGVVQAAADLLNELVAPPRFLIPHYAVIVQLRPYILGKAQLHWTLEAFAEQFALRRIALERLMTFLPPTVASGLLGVTRYADDTSSALTIARVNPAYHIVYVSPSPYVNPIAFAGMLYQGVTLNRMRSALGSLPKVGYDAGHIRDLVVGAVRTRLTELVARGPATGAKPHPLANSTLLPIPSEWLAAPAKPVLKTADLPSSYYGEWADVADLIYAMLEKQLIRVVDFCALFEEFVTGADEASIPTELGHLVLQVLMAPSIANQVSESAVGRQLVNALHLAQAKHVFAPSPAKLTLTYVVLRRYIESHRDSRMSSSARDVVAKLGSKPVNEWRDDDICTLGVVTLYAPNEVARWMIELLYQGHGYGSNDVNETPALPSGTLVPNLDPPVPLAVVHMLSLRARSDMARFLFSYLAPKAVRREAFPPGALDTLARLLNSAPNACALRSLFNFVLRTASERKRLAVALSELFSARLVNWLVDNESVGDILVGLSDYLTKTSSRAVYAAVQHLILVLLPLHNNLESPLAQLKTRQTVVVDSASMQALAMSLAVRGVAVRGKLGKLPDVVTAIAQASPATLKWPQHVLMAFPAPLVDAISTVAASGKAARGHRSGSKSNSGKFDSGSGLAAMDVVDVSEAAHASLWGSKSWKDAAPTAVEVSAYDQAHSLSEHLCGASPVLTATSPLVKRVVAAEEAAWAATMSGSSAGTEAGDASSASSPLYLRDVLSWFWMTAFTAASDALVVNMRVVLDAVKPHMVTRALFHAVAFAVSHISDSYAGATSKAVERGVARLVAMAFEWQLVDAGELIMALLEVDANPIALQLLQGFLTSSAVSARASLWFGSCDARLAEAEPPGAVFGSWMLPALAAYEERFPQRGRSPDALPTYYHSEMSRLTPYLQLVLSRFIAADAPEFVTSVLLAPPLNFVVASVPRPMQTLHDLLHYHAESSGLTPEVKRALVRTFAFPRGSRRAQSDSELGHALDPAFVEYVIEDGVHTASMMARKLKMVNADGTSFLTRVLDSLTAHLPGQGDGPPAAGPHDLPYASHREFKAAAPRLAMAAAIQVLALPLAADDAAALLLADTEARRGLAKAGLLARLPSAYHVPVLYAWIDAVKGTLQHVPTTFSLWRPSDCDSLIVFAHAFLLGVDAMMLECLPEFVRSIRPAVSISQVHVVCQIVGPAVYRMTKHGNLTIHLVLEVLQAVVDVLATLATSRSSTR